jgi:hypothetical protein
MAGGNLQNLKVNPGAKSSRFVIDLKRDLTEAEALSLKNKKNKLVISKLEELAEIDYKIYFGAGKEKTKTLIGNWRNNIKSLVINTLDFKEAKAKKINKTSFEKIKKPPNIISQLALVELVKLIFIIFRQTAVLIYKICFWVGWTLVFLWRLAFLILLIFIKPVIKIFNKISLKDSAKIKFKALAEKQPREYPPFGLIEYLKPVFIFAGVLLIIVLPVKAYTYYRSIDNIKGKVLGASASAVDDLISGGKSAANLDFSSADKSFTLASSNFLTAKNQLDEIDNLLFTLAGVLPDKNMRLAAASKNILSAGSLSAEAGKNLSLAVSGLFDYQPENTDKILSNLLTYGRRAINNLTALNFELNEIDSQVIPLDYQVKFILLKQKNELLLNGLKEFIDLAGNLENFLGLSSLKRYLLIFQNNSELRASGGFLGSFALIDFSRGQIKNIEVPGGGSYDTEAGLLKKIKSPEPLRLVSPDWYFWDANWWPDWSMSARKLAWFYENSDGSTVDGVISFTPTVMERLLKIIGPIDLKEKYGVVIDADNFWLTTQEFAEQKLAVTREPKKIIGDLMNKILEELPKRLNKDNLIPLLRVFEESLGDKNILFYFTDAGLQSQVRDLGWAGEIQETEGDYLSVINTNIAGGKSDRKIKQEIIHRAEIAEDGTIIDNLTIRRIHQAIKREPFAGVRNVDWLRIYVPLGSKLISADGFKPVDKIFFKTADSNWPDDPDVARGEGLAVTDQASGTKIYNELNKTVFANWSQLDPGESIEINLKYELPFKLKVKKEEFNRPVFDQLIEKANQLINPVEKSLFAYSLLAQKQPGMNSSSLISEIKFAAGYKPIWKFPLDLSVNQTSWFRTENFDQDKLTAIMLEK